MKNGHSSPGQDPPAHDTLIEARQSYLLLAFGILVAVTVPYLLQPRAATAGATPTTVIGSARPPMASP